jgi:hypothetical protein
MGKQLTTDAVVPMTGANVGVTDQNHILNLLNAGVGFMRCSAKSSNRASSSVVWALGLADGQEAEPVASR